MHRVTIEPDFTNWRLAARRLLAEGVAPTSVFWQTGQSGCQYHLAFSTTIGSTPCVGGPATHVPRPFLLLARLAACHRDPDRWSLLYRLLWRLTHGQRALLQDKTDPDVLQANAWVQSVRRDLNKMISFVRFSDVDGPEGRLQVAFYRPDHRIVRPAAEFFRRRFASLCWTIFTPDESATWDREQLQFGPGVSSLRAPTQDELVALWRTYYRATFQRDRLAADSAFAYQMPQKFWDLLPEAQDIAALRAGRPDPCETDDRKSAALRRVP